jgi:hypothetical protein
MLVVVGQGPSDKTQLAVQMLAAYDIGSSARVVQGQTSEVPFPTQMIDLYASASSSSAILQPEIVAGGDAAALTADFLARCSAPFALLLKPPHEMANLEKTILSKTTAAVYGSFNLATFRAALPASLSEEEKLLRQEALLHSFKLALWVERSLSVGRDSVLESEKFDGGGKKLWDCLLADKELVGMISAWNAQTLKTFAPKVSKGMNEIKAICDKSTAGPDATSPLWPELLVLLEGIDKKVQVMKSITKCKGSQVCAALSPPQARAICRPRVTCRPWPRILAHSLPLSFPRALASDPFASGCVQVCHADTLVAALLLDDKDALGPYTKKCRASHDAQLNPKPVLDGCEDSRLAVLMAPEAQRDDLEAASIRVLAACTACQMSPDSPRTPISRVGSMLATLVELNRGVLAHTLQLGRYRLWSELATVWNCACSLRHTLRLIARGEVRTLTGSMLRWLESHTGLLHQLRCMWNALSETVGDVMHEASSMVHHVAQSLATHLSGGWQMLAHWATRAMRGAVTASSRTVSHSHGEMSRVKGR